VGEPGKASIPVFVGVDGNRIDSGIFGSPANSDGWFSWLASSASDIAAASQPRPKLAGSLVSPRFA